MDELIGKSFKRNVYGLSEWTDTVVDVYIAININHDAFSSWTPIFLVQGTMHVFNINEIVFVNSDEN